MTTPPDAPGPSTTASSAASRRPRIHRDVFLFAVLLLALVGDQLTKLAVVASLRLGESVPAEGLFRFTYTTNTGSVFGLFPGQTAALTVASFVGVGILLYFYHAHPWPGRMLRLSLGLQLGGAIGNLADRLRLGHVVDFIDVGPWPVFNLADSSIVVGITLLVTLFLLEERSARSRASDLTPRGEGVPATEE